MFVSGRVPKPDVVGRQFRWNNSPFDSVRFICDFFSGMGIFLVSLGPCRKLRWQWNITISNIYIYIHTYIRDTSSNGCSCFSIAMIVFGSFTFGKTTSLGRHVWIVGTGRNSWQSEIIPGTSFLLYALQLLHPGNLT